MRAWMVFLACLVSCTTGGSSGEGELRLLSTNFISGETRAVNLPLEFHFDRAVEVESLSLASIQIEPEGAQGPVVGEFHVRNEGRTVSFQPLCPDSINDQWGFQPGEGGYSVILQDPLRGKDGTALAGPLIFSFRTASPPAEIVQDLKPANPPRVEAREDLPTVLGQNLFSRPNEPLEILLDQAVRLDSLGTDPVRLTYGDDIPLPVETMLTKNCTASGGAVLTVTPVGILPGGESVSFFLNGDLQGLGTEDSNPEDVRFHVAAVQEAPRPLQRDTLVETFDTQDWMDPEPDLPLPLAAWGEGRLQAAPLWPGTKTGADFIIGGNSPNGASLVFDTTGGVLLDNDGVPHFFADGILEVNSLTLGAGGVAGVMRITGPNPLIIRAADRVIINRGSRLMLNGQGGADVTNIGAPTSESKGGTGYASGGDGGRASWETTQSTPHGENGNGAFNALYAGGGGGGSGYGMRSTLASRGGGGGGGNWNIREIDANGDAVEFCFGPERWMTDCDANAPTCFATANQNNSNGEYGGGGVRGNVDCEICQVNGDSVCAKDAPTGGCWPQPGTPGPPVFADGDANNNFWGRKPVLENGLLRVIPGELQRLQGGQGGGGGGDSIGGYVFPSGSFPGNNVRGAGGGGGGGAVHIQSQVRVTVRGSIISYGGRGGNGEKPSQHRTGPGGGGGAGGMIVLEAPIIRVGPHANLISKGGIRGLGGGTQPGYTGGSGGINCRKNETAARGGAGGKGLIQFLVPFEEGTSITCGGVTQPMIQDGSLIVQRSTVDPIDRIIHCERDLTPAGRYGPAVYAKIDPPPQILITNFGARSGHQSRWIHLGKPAFAPDLVFEGTDAEGMVDSLFERSLFSGSGDVVDQSGFVVVIENEALAGWLRSEPLSLRENRLRSSNLGRRRILSASLDGDRVTLELDPTGGEIPVLGDWEILQDFFRTTVDGIDGAFPTSASAQIRFAGAWATEPGSGIPDAASSTGWVAHPNDIHHPVSGAAPDFLRFQVLFHSNVNKDPLDGFLPLPGLKVLRLPFSF